MCSPGPPRRYINPSDRACSSHKNRFKYGFRPDCQSVHRLSQSGRRKSHTHSLNTLIGRVALSRERASKIKSARQVRCTALESLDALIIGWAHFSILVPSENSKAKAIQQSSVPTAIVPGIAELEPVSASYRKETPVEIRTRVRTVETSRINLIVRVAPQGSPLLCFPYFDKKTLVGITAARPGPAPRCAFGE
jgi:hypothetical protein